MNETAWQKKIVDGFTQAGGYGHKLANAFIGGIPDLLLSLPDFGPAIAEVKMFQEPQGLDTKMQLPHPLTVLQHNTLIKMRAGGVAVGWIGILPLDQGRAKIWVSADISRVPTKREFMACHLNRAKAQGWDQLAEPIMLALRPRS